MAIFDLETKALLRENNIREEDIIEKFVRSSGKGGQNVNKVSTCVYLKHLPTGIEVKHSSGRTQGVNRKNAWAELIRKIKFAKDEKIKAAINAVEKIKRKNRPKPASIKRKILDDKKVHSTKKEMRRKPVF
jgi:protein subunit release factor B